MKNVSSQSYPEGSCLLPDACCHYSWWILDFKSSIILRENQVKVIMYHQQDIDSIRFCLLHSSPLLLWSWDKWIEKRELNKVFQSDLQLLETFAASNWGLKWGLCAIYDVWLVLKRVSLCRKAMDQAVNNPRLLAVLGEHIEKGPCTFSVIGSLGTANLHLRAVKFEGTVLSLSVSTLLWWFHHCRSCLMQGFSLCVKLLIQ